MLRTTVLLGVCAIAWTGCFCDLAVAQSEEVASQAEAIATDSAQVEKNAGQQPEAQASSEFSLRSPRATMGSFVAAMERDDLRAAVAALDFSEIMPPPDVFQQIDYAQKLKTCIDRIALVDPELISDAADGPEVTFPPDKEDAVIRFAKSDDQQWRFSSATIARLGALYDILKDKPPIGKTIIIPQNEAVASETDAEKTAEEKEVVEETPDRVVDHIPEHLRSARRVMRTLFESLAEKKYSEVISALDFSELEAAQGDLGPWAELEQARHLKAVIERMANFEYRDISDDPSGPLFRFPPTAEKPPIEIERDAAGVWRFSAATVANIDAMYEIYRDRKVLFLTGEQRPWLRRELLMGQEVWQILTLFGAIFLSVFLGQCVRAVTAWRAAATRDRERLLTTLTLETVAKTFPAIAFVLGLAVGLSNLTLPFNIDLFAGTILHVVVTLIIGYISFRLVDVVVGFLRDMANRTGSTLNDMLVPIVSTSLRLTVIVMVVLEIATAVSDQPPSAVIAGLGAGGLAIGLAAQDTIKNFFGSVMIFADRPFELGDRIVIDGHDGPVESVGFRSTRIRTLDGHLVTIPNGEMAYKTIHNIGKRPYIRRVMNIRLAFGSGPDKIQQALEIVRELLDQHEGYEADRPPRVFLEDFLESAVNLRAIYWFHPPNYWDYCAFGERLNLQIMERFRAAGIDFALPAKQLFVSGTMGDSSSEQD